MWVLGPYNSFRGGGLGFLAKVTVGLPMWLHAIHACARPGLWLWAGVLTCGRGSSLSCCCLLTDLRAVLVESGHAWQAAWMTAVLAPWGDFSTLDGAM